MAIEIGRREFIAGLGGAAATALPVFVDDAFAAKASQRLLLKGGCVLTFDQKLGDFDQADVLIEGKKIVAVANNLAATDAAVIDASGTIVLPGFIDTHHHLYQALLRNIQGNGVLADYFRDVSNRPRSATQFYLAQDA